MILNRKYYPVISIFVVVFVLAWLLALTNSFACTNLEFQKDQQTLEMLSGIFPEAEYYIYDERTEIYNIYDISKNQTGHAFLTTGEGHHGKIKILIGLSDEETIRNIVIISHEEQKVLSEVRTMPLYLGSFIKQFTDLKITDCELKKYDGQIDAITGATISSMAVVNIIREAALEKFGPKESKMEWQYILALATVIPFVITPVVLTWYTTIKQARAKRATHNEGSR